MHINPYKFTGPLYPEKDALVCIPRKNELNKVITGIRNDDYWAILGPRQIGKTTFLRQLMQELAAYHCIYINLEISPQSHEGFYAWIIEQIQDKIPAQAQENQTINQNDYGPEVNFYNFLKNFKPVENRKIILFLDEIEKAPLVSSFLHAWRKVFHERNDQPELNRYSVVIAGAADLIALTMGPTSPFNIAQKLYLQDFNPAQIHTLIEKPLAESGISISPEVVSAMQEETEGHPQLLQHACHIMLENIDENAKNLTIEDYQQAKNQFFVENDSLRTLDYELKHNKVLMGILSKILSGEQVSYFQHQEIAITGAGPIKQNKGFCIIRNSIYRTLILKEIKQPEPPVVEQHQDLQLTEYETLIFIAQEPAACNGDVAEKKFLNQLFDPENTKIDLNQNGRILQNIQLDDKDKILLLYLAYKNYKAIQEGYEGWKKIPTSYKYRLSSNIENNKTHEPEWEIFIRALGKDPYGDDIRAWIFSLRKCLGKYDAKDLVHSESGRGQGYLLKGKVKFSSRK